MKKVKLKVLGISYSQTQSGSYALVLGEENGDRRIPIIIGGFEAQAIAIQLEGLTPPRPLTHDLFHALAEAYNISLVEVFINRLKNGVFYCELVCDNRQSRIKIDARTSDSIAIALRFNCPIYTTTDILERAGISMRIDQEDKKTFQQDEGEFSHLTGEELETLLAKAIKEENYELAVRLRDEQVRRKSRDSK